MIGIISAVSENGIIGKNGDIPWNYPEDFKWFKKKTLNSVVIMGRKTYDSIGKPLPKRENVVITRSKINNSSLENNVSCFTSIPNYFNQEKYTLRNEPINYWFIGGSSIYEEGMLWAQEIYLTLTPDYITGNNLIKFPWINPNKFEFVEKTRLDLLIDLDKKSNLYIAKYKKI